MAFRFNPCPSCCGISCIYFEDNFDRSDDTDLGSDWTEVAGAWEIASNVLSTASDDAICKCETDGTLDYVVRAALKGGSTSDEFRVIFDYDDDANYKYARITRPTESTTRAFFVSVVTGTHTVAATSTAWTHNLGTTTLYVQICVGSDDARISTGVTADFANVRPRLGVFSFSTSSGTCGVGTGTNGVTAVTFDQFSIQRALSSPPHDECPECECECSGTPPLELEVIISGITGSCGATDCADKFADTFILGINLVPITLDLLCNWGKILDFEECGGGPVPDRLSALYLDGLLTIRFIDGNANLLIEWNTIPPTTCSSWSSVNVPFSSQSFACDDASGSTCTVSAL